MIKTKHTHARTHTHRIDLIKISFFFLLQLFDCKPLSISPSKHPSKSLPLCFRSINCKNFFKSLPIKRTSGSFNRIHANFSCSFVEFVDCWDVDGERFELLWSFVYSPNAVVIFSWTSSIKLDSVTPWTSNRNENHKFELNEL